jgi:hypothetical protein
MKCGAIKRYSLISIVYFDNSASTEAVSANGRFKRIISTFCVEISGNARTGTSEQLLLRQIYL